MIQKLSEGHMCVKFLTLGTFQPILFCLLYLGLPFLPLHEQILGIEITFHNKYLSKPCIMFNIMPIMKVANHLKIFQETCQKKSKSAKLCKLLGCYFIAKVCESYSVYIFSFSDVPLLLSTLFMELFNQLYKYMMQRSFSKYR